MKLKLKLKEEEKFFQICKEIAKKLDEISKGMSNRMWNIGKIIAEKRKEINPKYGDRFLKNIAEEMRENITPHHLGNCEIFYNKFPNLSARTDKSKLSPTHYARISLRDLTEEETKKYEKLASENNWSVRELEEALSEERESDEILDEKRMMIVLPINYYKRLEPIAENQRTDVHHIILQIIGEWLDAKKDNL